MIKSSANIGRVKDEIAGLKEKDVGVMVNLGRNKTVSYTGRLSGVYPDIFTVLPYGQFKGKTTFSYSEVICGNVTVSKLDDVKTSNE